MSEFHLSALERFPKHRYLLERAVTRFQADHRILGLMVSGSISTGSADFYSDVDLEIVVRDEDFDTVFAERETTTEVIGRPLFRFIADHLPVGEHLYIVLYEGPVKFDFDYQRASKMKPHWKVANCSILKDTTEFLATVISQSQRLTTPQPAPERLLALNQKFWTWCWYAFGKIVRGELWEALDAVHSIRSLALLPMIDWDAARPHEGYRRLESKIDSHLAVRLKATIPTLQPEALYTALQVAMDLFCGLRERVFSRSGVAFDPRPEQDLRKTMDQYWVERAKG